MAINLNPSVGFNNVQRNIAQASEEIVSGRRINSASDDVAGLGIAVNINTRIRSQDIAMSNVVTGVSLVQTAQGGLGRISEGLQQIRELGIQANNGILTDSDRASLQSQADQILSGLRDTLANTTFNGASPLTSEDSVELQLGSSAGDRFTIEGQNLASTLENLGLNAIVFNDPEGLSSAINTIDQSLAAVNQSAAEFGAVQNRLESTFNSLADSNLRQVQSVSRIEDADLAKSISELLRNQILQQSQIALQGQANAQRGQVLSLLGA